jgi:hypothetical protein
MDGVVSWQEALAISKLHYPKADQSTILYFAKEIYLVKQNVKLIKQAKVKEEPVIKLKERLNITGC